MSMPSPPCVVEQSSPPRGLAIRLIAVVLILVGTFDMMLSWRGSMQIDGFYIALFVSGVVLYCVGAALASRGRAQEDIHALNKDREIV